MEEKELLTKITLPDGWAIDEEKSKGEQIVLKKVDKPKRFIDNPTIKIKGFYIDEDYSTILGIEINNNTRASYNVFATEKQAKSALAMARISQIMANDERFGGIITDKEWINRNIIKYVIVRHENNITKDIHWVFYHFLAFHTIEQRDLFLKENKQLVKDYLMVD